MRSAKFFWLTPIFLSAGFTTFTGTADAATVNCGQVITQSTVLEGNVGPCPGNGIIIGASGITLDLGGHTVSGASSGGGGVLIAYPYGGATVRNGTVTGFEFGVSITRSAGNTLERLLAQGNCTGLRLHGLGSAGPVAFDNLIRENLFRNNRCSGISTFQAAWGNTIERNAIVGNAGPGISMIAAGLNNAPRNNRFVQNVIRNNGADGIHLGPLALANAITGNVITANAGHGVRLAASGGSFGAFLNTLEQNQIYANGVDGVLAEPGTFSNRINGNVVVRNRRYDLAEESSPPCQNTWTANTFLTRNRECIT